MLATTLAFVGVNGIVRHLGTELPAAQSAFIRFAFGLVFLACTSRGRGRRAADSANVPRASRPSSFISLRRPPITSLLQKVMLHP